jgi:hypothetical protein
VPHARQQIRERIVQEVTGLQTTGSTVYETRIYPHDVLPSLAVYTLRDQVVEPQTLGKQVHRMLRVAIEARAKPADGGATVDDQLDTICAEVEAAIMDDPTLGSMVQTIELVETEIEVSGTLERPVGVARMLWDVTYTVAADDPTQILWH